MSTLNEILNQFSKKQGQIAVLIDPEKVQDESLLQDLLKKAAFAGVDYLFVGGSTVTREEFQFCIECIKRNSNIPLVIFPGASYQVSEEADALLYLSLISGRNPDYLIGHHVASASEVYDMNLEVIPTGYILVDGGTNSSVAYVSQTTPIPANKTSIITRTAKAGILQGKQLLYLDAGSGAKSPVPSEIISRLSELPAPLIIGGGIRSIERIHEIRDAGANVIVIGNKIEEDIDFLLDIKLYIESEHG
ncbi:geranylgeranylglyceryl/heptaprenylglyceryl phosphate synthase [Crocinitomicaceae bacterium]|nr:geranylgeranylglyceryl/heptaprenylglyceryl phosphate synthase [Crocinitomicaceae bacterium]